MTPMNTEIIKAVELIEDFSLYPRSKVDATHVQYLAHSLAAGETLPPLIVDQQNRLIDGFHRRRAYLRIFGDKSTVCVERRKYKEDKEAFLDALRLNSRHGKGITGSEQTGAIIKANQFKIDHESIASAMGITSERYQVITRSKIAKIDDSKMEIALKRSVMHLRRKGNKVSKSQVEAINSAPGQPQSLILLQINRLIESDLIDWDNEKVVNGFKRLWGNLEKAKEHFQPGDTNE